MTKLKLTFANLATEIVDGISYKDAVKSRFYAKHRVTKAELLNYSKPTHPSLFN